MIACKSIEEKCNQDINQNQKKIIFCIYLKYVWKGGVKVKCKEMYVI